MILNSYTKKNLKLEEWFIRSNFYSKKKLQNEEVLIRRGNINALHLFHEAAERVPAYKDFLKKQAISPSSIKTIKDFNKIPFTDKQNYIDIYPLEKLVWDGKLNSSLVINTSSGTTGNPYFWPCSHEEFIQGASLHKMLYERFFDIRKKNTLIIVCFGMGTWVAGIYTFLSTYLFGVKEKNVSIITPGFNKEETLRILSNLGPKYEQTIIAGYPTFIKDVLEQWGDKEKMKGIVKFIFAGEGITETWRDYVLDMVGSTNHFQDALCILGSADANFMGFETPYTILLRKKVSNNPQVSKLLFNNERTPSIVSFIPTHRFFEESNGELILTANRAIPLIRYNMHDIGGVISKSRVEDILEQYKISLSDKSFKVNFKDKDNDLPVVYLFGRGKFTVTIYAANIYTENVKEVLIDRAIRKFVTGKFKLETKDTKKHVPFLQLDIELAERVKPTQQLRQKIIQIFTDNVRRMNSEYNKVFEEYGDKVKPLVNLYLNSDPGLFPKGKLKKMS